MKILKKFWIVFALLLLAAVVFTWFNLRSVAVDSVAAKTAPLVRTLQFSARVATLSRVDIGSTLTARVAQVSVREGDRVKKGDLLLALESEEFSAALAQALATEQQALARLQGLQSTGRASSAANLAQTEANLLAALTELKRSQQLVTQGFVSPARMDEAQRAVDVARAQRSAAQAQLQAGSDTGSDVLQAQAQLRLAHAASSVARSRLAQTRVLAPADAKVLSRGVEPGAIVQPGRALMSLALEGATQLNAQVDERFLDQLAVGQSASVLADAFAGQRFLARVLSIAPAVDPQRGAIEVKFALLQAPPAFLREDMTLSVEVETARLSKALAVPVSALRSSGSDGSASVWVMENGRAQSRTVKLGLRSMENVQIVEGLKEGERVLLGGTFPMGQRVRLRSPHSP